MFYTASPTADAERHEDALEAAEGHASAALKELTSNPCWQLLADGLDYGNGPKTREVLDLLIDAAQGRDVCARAKTLMGRILEKWLDQNPEYMEEVRHA